MATNIGWKVIGSESNVRIAEFRSNAPHDTLMPYKEAKAAALQRLRDHVSPYRGRIEELEQDVFADTGALPPFRAWRCSYGSKAIVTAKTKKRATELARENRYGFDCSWRECVDDWWYHLAQEEGIWVEEQDDRGQGNGIFYKPLDRVEAEQILEPYIAPYRTMDVEQLFAQAGQTSTATGVSSQGTPYKITTKVVREAFHGNDAVYVYAHIDDCLGWGYGHSTSVKRDLPELAVVGTEEWVKEGF